MNFKKTDPEFMERFEHFAFEEVPEEEGQQLDVNTRYIAILSVLIGCQGVSAYREMLTKALEEGVSPVEGKEMVYQSVEMCRRDRLSPWRRALAQRWVTRLGVLCCGMFQERR